MRKIDLHIENSYPKAVKQYSTDMIQHINFESTNRNFLQQNRKFLLLISPKYVHINPMLSSSYQRNYTILDHGRVTAIEIDDTAFHQLRNHLMNNIQ